MGKMILILSLYTLGFTAFVIGMTYFLGGIFNRG
jgi:hypothetical protein